MKIYKRVKKQILIPDRKVLIGAEEQMNEPGCELRLQMLLSTDTSTDFMRLMQIQAQDLMYRRKGVIRLTEWKCILCSYVPEITGRGKLYLRGSRTDADFRIVACLSPQDARNGFKAEEIGEALAGIWKNPVCILEAFMPDTEYEDAVSCRFEGLGITLSHQVLTIAAKE